MEVKIIRSRRRKRTIGARLIKDELLVSAPLAISQERLDKIIAGFKIKFSRKKNVLKGEGCCETILLL